jgi:protein-L-isoaspartate(D-aspartate) O-methyltransferase
MEKKLDEIMDDELKKRFLREKEFLAKQWSSFIDKRVIDAFMKVKRENFVLKEFLQYSYEDAPLPILDEQTISQPTTVMMMTNALEVKEGQKILEVGAGSGYQAAILAELVGEKGKVITTDIIAEVCEFARENIRNAGIKNTEVICYDGSTGYEKEAPYNRIIVTAACPRIPQPLIEQLKLEGIIVAPVATMFGQEMLKVRKHEASLETKSLGYFAFVPLTGKYGFNR